MKLDKKEQEVEVGCQPTPMAEIMTSLQSVHNELDCKSLDKQFLILYSNPVLIPKLQKESGASILIAQSGGKFHLKKNTRPDLLI